MTPDDRGSTTEFEEAARDKAVETLPAEVVAYIEECNGRPHASSYLIPVLHKVQEECGYLSDEALEAVSVLMQIPAAKVTGVASFYHLFDFSPGGQHTVSLCMGTACFVKGAGVVLDTLKELLGIGLGETTEDGRFSLEVARCVGACALAPVLFVDEKVYSEVSPDVIGRILAEYGYEGR